jgi:hypothetical protein
VSFCPIVKLPNSGDAILRGGLPDAIRTLDFEQVERCSDKSSATPDPSARVAAQPGICHPWFPSYYRVEALNAASSTSSSSPRKWTGRRGMILSTALTYLLKRTLKLTSSGMHHPLGCYVSFRVCIAILPRRPKSLPHDGFENREVCPQPSLMH